MPSRNGIPFPVLDTLPSFYVHFRIVERNVPLTVLAVYTGDPSHKARSSLFFPSTHPTTSLQISVTALSPSPSLSQKDAQAEWDKALHHLRRDGARPKEVRSSSPSLSFHSNPFQTPHGVLMATSLAHFRSDYTIVHIPGGNYLAIRDQLYTNINLLRMGCSGRTALTLEEPT
jgi:hypothetical protein